MTPKHSIPGIQVPGQPVKRNLSRHRLYASDPADVAWGKWVPPSQERPQFTGGAYTDAVQAVTRDHSPKLHSQYP